MHNPTVELAEFRPARNEIQLGGNGRSIRWRGALETGWKISSAESGLRPVELNQREYSYAFEWTGDDILCMENSRRSFRTTWTPANAVLGMARAAEENVFASISCMAMSAPLLSQGHWNVSPNHAFILRSPFPPILLGFLTHARKVNCALKRQSWKRQCRSSVGQDFLSAC